MSWPDRADPTVQLWEKVRKPLGVVAVIGVAVGQLPRLTSGAVFPTITGLLFVAFFAWLALEFGFRPVGLVVVAVPLLALAATVYMRRLPERMAEAHRP